MKLIDSLNIRGKILVPTISLIAIALLVMGVLAWTANDTSAKYQSLIFGPRLASKVSVAYAGHLSELGRVINLALLEGDSADLDKLEAELNKL